MSAFIDHATLTFKEFNPITGVSTVRTVELCMKSFEHKDDNMIDMEFISENKEVKIEGRLTGIMSEMDASYIASKVKYPRFPWLRRY